VQWLTGETGTRCVGNTGSKGDRARLKFCKLTGEKSDKGIQRLTGETGIFCSRKYWIKEIK
jgi:hypothetical protein